MCGQPGRATPGPYRRTMPSSHCLPTGLAVCTNTSAGQPPNSARCSTMGRVVSSPPRSWSRLIASIGVPPRSKANASALVLAHVHPSGGTRSSSTHNFIGRVCTLPPRTETHLRPYDGGQRRPCHQWAAAFGRCERPERRPRAGDRVAVEDRCRHSLLPTVRAAGRLSHHGLPMRVSQPAAAASWTLVRNSATVPASWVPRSRTRSASTRSRVLIWSCIISCQL